MKKNDWADVVLGMLMIMLIISTISCYCATLVFARCDGLSYGCTAQCQYHGGLNSCVKSARDLSPGTCKNSEAECADCKCAVVNPISPSDCDCTTE
jgi:hypothetical protein